MNNLDSHFWYRGLKVVAYVWLAAAFFIPWIMRDATGYPTYAVVVGNILEGLFNVAAWLIVFYLLRKVVIYIALGKQAPQPKRPLKPMENWADFYKVAGIGIIILGAAGYLFLLAFMVFS